MFTVATVKLFDNNTVEVCMVDTSEEARAHRCKQIDELLTNYPEVDFNVIGSEFADYQTVASDHDQKHWMVIKITKHDA